MLLQNTELFGSRIVSRYYVGSLQACPKILTDVPAGIHQFAALRSAESRTSARVLRVQKPLCQASILVNRSENMHIRYPEISRDWCLVNLGSAKTLGSGHGEIMPCLCTWEGCWVTVSWNPWQNGASLGNWKLSQLFRSLSSASSKDCIFIYKTVTCSFSARNFSVWLRTVPWIFIASRRRGEPEDWPREEPQSTVTQCFFSVDICRHRSYIYHQHSWTLFLLASGSKFSGLRLQVVPTTVSKYTIYVPCCLWERKPTSPRDTDSFGRRQRQRWWQTLWCKSFGSMILWSRCLPWTFLSAIPGIAPPGRKHWRSVTIWMWIWPSSQFSWQQPQVFRS